MLPDKNHQLDQILESTVVSNWADLMHGAQTGLIHIEYGFAADGALDYLKLWSSITRGHWLLAAEYWMSASTFHSAGVRFDNGYQSHDLARTLDFVMQHQNAFVLPKDLGRQGLLQISTPTEQQRILAAVSIKQAYECVGSTLAEPALALLPR